VQNSLFIAFSRTLQAWVRLISRKDCREFRVLAFIFFPCAKTGGEGSKKEGSPQIFTKEIVRAHGDQGEGESSSNREQILHLGNHADPTNLNPQIILCLYDNRIHALSLRTTDQAIRHDLLGQLDGLILELECIDRMYRNPYMPRLTSENGIACFFRGHLGHRFASTKEGSGATANNCAALGLRDRRGIRISEEVVSLDHLVNSLLAQFGPQSASREMSLPAKLCQEYSPLAVGSLLMTDFQPDSDVLPEIEAEESKKEKRSGIGLCLSGGGFRAAFFHLGALRRLHELGLLAQVSTISSVSGGSIISAALADCLVRLGGFDKLPLEAWDAKKNEGKIPCPNSRH
jgi:hypothetical protein